MSASLEGWLLGGSRPWNLCLNSPNTMLSGKPVKTNERSVIQKISYSCICMYLFFILDYIFQMLINLDFTEKKKYNKIICAKQIKVIKNFNMLFCVKLCPSWHKIQLAFLQLPFSLCNNRFPQNSLPCR